MRLYKKILPQCTIIYRKQQQEIYLFFFLFFTGDDELHPIQYYPEPPSKSESDKLISSLISTETAAEVLKEASANSLSDSLLHILD